MVQQVDDVPALVGLAAERGRQDKRAVDLEGGGAASPAAQTQAWSICRM